MRVYFAGPLFTPYERSFIDECAARLRADGIEVFVPHENALAEIDTSPSTIFAKDWEGLANADAVVAMLDGSMVDDGTACEIGIFYALMQSDPSKKARISCRVASAVMWVGTLPRSKYDWLRIPAAQLGMLPRWVARSPSDIDFSCGFQFSLSR